VVLRPQSDPRRPFRRLRALERLRAVHALTSPPATRSTVNDAELNDGLSEEDVG